MNFTKWFKLRKPEQEEFYDVDDFNFNADILDTELKNVKDSYLPLVGGTVTGDVVINGALTVPNGVIRTNDTSKAIDIRCTADDKSGAKLLLGGKDATNNAGEFVITATNGTNSFNFWGLPNGKLSWGNKNIVRSVNSVNADDNGNVSITSVNHAISADSATSASSATKASQNASGHLLADTIVKFISIDGRTITVTKIDGTSYTLTTQDTSTVYTKLSQFINDIGYITADGRAYPREAGGGNLNFHWSGKDGQPTWLWGGEDGSNMYVYNPSKFSVKYAESAGYAGSAGSVAWGNILGIPNLVSVASGYNATNGYCKLSDGTIFQYYKLPNGSSYGRHDITWAIPFSSTNYVVMVHGVTYVFQTTTMCQVNVAQSGSGGSSYNTNMWVLAYGK